MQEPDNQFEVLKIVLDKGAFALLIALFGAVISLLIERYKSILTRQIELNKITTPMIISMLEANEELFTANCVFIRDSAAEFADFKAWTEAMLAHCFTLPPGFLHIDIPHGPDCRKSVVSVNGNPLTIEAFLVRYSPSQRITSLIKSEPFWANEVVTGEESSLVEILYSASMANNPESFCGAADCTAARIYAGSRGASLKANLCALNKFRLLAMKNLDPTNRAQRRAMKAIIKTLATLQDTLLDFPISDVGVSVGFAPKETPTTYNVVLNCHAALISQLKNFLRAQ